MEVERIYKEQFEALDNAEIESRAEKAIALLDPAEISTEDLKQNQLRRARFAELTKCFYNPEGVVAHRKQLDHDNLLTEANLNAGFSDDKQGLAENQKYYPAVAEQWKNAFMELRHSNILKFPRVLQTLFYLLGY
jgi:hypothetical protein